MLTAKKKKTNEALLLFSGVARWRVARRGFGFGVGVGEAWRLGCGRVRQETEGLEVSSIIIIDFPQGQSHELTSNTNSLTYF